MYNEYESSLADKVVLIVKGLFYILISLLLASIVWPAVCVRGWFEKRHQTSLIDRLARGDYAWKDIQEVMDDAVDKWHDGNSKLELHEYLGMTWEEYKRWAEKPDAIYAILDERLAKRNKELGL
jgi:hypothetical protein